MRDFLLADDVVNALHLYNYQLVSFNEECYKLIDVLGGLSLTELELTGDDEELLRRGMNSAEKKEKLEHLSMGRARTGIYTNGLASLINLKQLRLKMISSI